ncbi:hypothetical protein D3C81_1243580 [compost metagenome]
MLNPLKWAFTFLLVVIGWVIFRAENLDVAWRMYAAMFSFADWQLSELFRAQLTSLQISTLVLAYVVLAIFGIRQFYAQPLAGAPKAKAKEDDETLIASADGTAALPRARLQIGALAFHAAVLVLFTASVLKLSAQSFSPFLYFQF